MFQKAIKYFKHLTEGILALLLLTIFSIFCINVLSRYIFGTSYGWIIEASLILWVWLIFFGCSFCLKESDHVRIDFVYNRLPLPYQKLCQFISLLAIFIGTIFMISPTWSYISFLSIRPSDVMEIPMNYIYIIYMVFLVSLLVRSGYQLVKILIDTVFTKMAK